MTPTEQSHARKRYENVSKRFETALLEAPELPLLFRKALERVACGVEAKCKETELWTHLHDAKELGAAWCEANEHSEEFTFRKKRWVLRRGVHSEASVSDWWKTWSVVRLLEDREALRRITETEVIERYGEDSLVRVLCARERGEPWEARHARLLDAAERHHAKEQLGWLLLLGVFDRTGRIAPTEELFEGPLQQVLDAHHGEEKLAWVAMGFCRMAMEEGLAVAVTSPLLPKVLLPIRTPSWNVLRVHPVPELAVQCVGMMALPVLQGRYEVTFWMDGSLRVVVMGAMSTVGWTARIEKAVFEEFSSCLKLYALVHEEESAVTEGFCLRYAGSRAWLLPRTREAQNRDEELRARVLALVESFVSEEPTHAKRVVKCTERATIRY